MSSEAQILNGREIAQKYFEAFSKEASALMAAGHKLGLATVQVGDSKDTLLYSKAIGNLFKKVNIPHTPKVFEAAITQKALCEEIEKLNADPLVTGILIFAPLPKHIDTAVILGAVSIQKDAEGRSLLNRPGERLAPPTAMASVALIEETGVDLEGKEAVVIGRSDVVGKPAAILLIEKRATVTVCNSKTKNLKSFVERADIVIATAGQPHLVKGDWIKPGAIVVDVGENVVDGKPVGDVEFEAAKKRASFITPVPGGVGPVTNMMLLKNLLTLAKLQNKPSKP